MLRQGGFVIRSLAPMSARQGISFARFGYDLDAMSRLLTLMMIFVLVLAHGSSVAAAICRHQDGVAHVAALQSSDAGISAAAFGEEAAGKAASRKGAPADAGSVSSPSDMLPTPGLTVAVPGATNRWSEARPTLRCSSAPRSARCWSLPRPEPVRPRMARPEPAQPRVPMTRRSDAQEAIEKLEIFNMLRSVLLAGAVTALLPNAAFAQDARPPRRRPRTGRRRSRARAPATIRTPTIPRTSSSPASRATARTCFRARRSSPATSSPASFGRRSARPWPASPESRRPRSAPTPRGRCFAASRASGCGC